MGEHYVFFRILKKGFEDFKSMTAEKGDFLSFGVTSKRFSVCFTVYNDYLLKHRIALQFEYVSGWGNHLL